MNNIKTTFICPHGKDTCGMCADAALNQWVPINERLPDGGANGATTVLVTVVNADGMHWVEQLRFEDDGRGFMLRDAGLSAKHVAVTAWMPIAEPYVPEGR